ncbi:YnfA family protein [Falsigemmobacter faecalis]|uniref:YnfA family protein n=1 Tax=Falsigemmobacter faecalis TaxID=2488730 RepID=A0A3P3DYN9_9RHOB|nr:YnfA family protein [Falsigemmobacter faecalis]RRH77938.1 YnfA family protein [Falsigemmobacter faecalis]
MGSAAPTLALFALAALAEIAGCFAFWAWARMEQSALWLLPGLGGLLLFAWLLTRAESDFAGRAYAAYGGIYILCSLGWLWAVEGQAPGLRDLAGALLCLCGAALILSGARSG